MPIFRLPQQQGNGLGTIIERVASSGASRAILFETSVALDLVQSHEHKNFKYTPGRLMKSRTVSE